MARRYGRRGFTLVELIVVIAILAVLAAIAVPSVMNVMDKARHTGDAATAKTYENALNMFVAQVANAGSSTILPSSPTATDLQKIQNAIVHSMGTGASFTPNTDGWSFWVSPATLRVEAAGEAPTGFVALPKTEVPYRQFTAAELPPSL